MIQKHVILMAKPRGFHLITSEVLSLLPEVEQIEVGMLNLFIQHSSASLTINENTDHDVRGDMERYFMHSVPEDAAYFKHTLEGPDDMPAHIKASILGSSVSVPIGQGRLLLGTWQGIWMGEHRVNAAQRSVIASIF